MKPLERRQLDNGLIVIAERRGLGPVVFSGVVYNVGSRDERPGVTGISHLLEHMMFKGTKKYGKGDVAAIVEKNGGELNAFTSEDVTMYYEVFARDRWELSLEIEAERMQNLRIDEDELEPERQVVLEERVMYLDIPAVELSEELAAAAFRESPYRWPIIGWEYDIQSISRDDLLEHYRKYYSPGNAALVVVGDVDPSDVFAAAERHFGRAPAGNGIQRRIPREPELKGVLRLDLDREASLPHLQVLFRAPEIHTRDAEALGLLANILSGSRTARLDLALLETNKVGDIQVHYHPKTDPSTFTISVEGQPAVSLEEVEAILWKELEGLASREVDADELDRSRTQVEAHHLFAMQSPSNRGFALAWHEAHGNVGYVDEAVGRLRSLTAGELMDAARRYFNADRCAVARIAGPDGEGEGGTAGASRLGTTGAALWHPGIRDRRHRSGLASAPVRDRLQLANGMNVVLQPDRTDPVVSVSFVFEGGSALDPEGREGLATLATDTMERGPKSRDFVAFTREFERLGSQFSLATGAELAHGEVTLLSRYAGTGLSLVADLLEDPGLRAEDLEVVRQLALNDLEARSDDLDDLAEERLLKDIAAGHPYARLPHGTREGLTAVTVEDLRRFSAEAYRPDRAHLAIVGDFDAAEVGSILERRYGKLPVPATVRTPIANFSAGTGDAPVAVLTRSDKAQAKICFGGAGLSAGDPDRLALIALNHVVGGSSIRSRLGDEIRDKMGLAYSVGSRNYERSRGGFFLVSLGTRPENVRKAVESVRAAIARLSDGVTATELDDARDYLTGSFPLRFTTYGRLARFWTRSSFYGWPEDYLDRYVETIRALDLADLRRVGARLAASARFLSVAGPVDDRLDPLPIPAGQEIG